MTFTSFFIMVGVFIALMFIYRRSDVWIKKLDPKTVKTVNWIGFGVAAAGGVLWFTLNQGIFMLITFAGVIVYFLFYGYDRPEEENK